MIGSQPYLRGSSTPLRRNYSDTQLHTCISTRQLNWHILHPKSPVTSKRIVKNSHKGINLFSKTQQIRGQKIAQLNRWNQIVGNRTKINSKIMGSILSSSSNPHSPPINYMDSKHKILLFFKLYRPDLCQAQFFLHAMNFFIPYIDCFASQQKICNIIMFVCANQQISPFISSSQSSKTARVYVLKEIIRKNLNIRWMPSEHPMSFFNEEDVTSAAKSLIYNLWKVFELVRGNKKTLLIEYLLVHKFSIDSLVTLIRIVLQSSPMNLSTLKNLYSFSTAQMIKAGKIIVIDDKVIPKSMEIVKISRQLQEGWFPSRYLQ